MRYIQRIIKTEVPSLVSVKLCLLDIICPLFCLNPLNVFCNFGIFLVGWQLYGLIAVGLLHLQQMVLVDIALLSIALERNSDIRAYTETDLMPSGSWNVRVEWRLVRDEVGGANSFSSSPSMMVLKQGILSVCLPCNTCISLFPSTVIRTITPIALVPLDKFFNHRQRQHDLPHAR
jgi:hypothetical protein